MAVQPGIAGMGLFVAVWMAVQPLAAAPPVAQDGTNQVSAEYLSHFRALLCEGFQARRAGLTAAEQHHRAAHALRPDDPRLEYAYGVVLLKNMQHSQAVAQFEKAAEGDNPSLPAIRAVIRETLRLKKYPEALEQLVSLTDRLAAPPGPHEPPHERTEIARWLGRVIGFLSDPLDKPAIREQALAEDAALRQWLPQELQEDYELGKQDVQVIAGDLQFEQQSVADAAKLKQQAEQAETAARRESYEDQQEELQQTKEEWDAWLADALGELDPQLEQLADQYGTLSRSVSSLAESIQATQLDIQRIRLMLDGGDSTVTEIPRPQQDRFNLIPTRNLSGQLIVRSQELGLYYDELSDVIMQRSNTVKQAQATLSQRAVAEQRYRKATGDVAKNINRVQQWDARLKKASEQAEKSPVSSGRVRSVANRSRTFSTYDSFDLDVERQRLLHSYDKPIP